MPISAAAPVADWLMPTPSEARIRLERVVMPPKSGDERRGRPLRTLGAVARRALLEETEAKLRMVLSDTLVDVMVGGWRAHAAIAQAVRKSRSQPDVDQVVPLRNHTITAHRQHNLDIEVDSVAVMTLCAELVLAVQLYDAVAIVRDGHLIAVRSGEAKADGRVTVDGVEVAKRTLTFPLTAELLHSPCDSHPTPGSTRPPMPRGTHGHAEKLLRYRS
jgi:hypothetical protein